MPRPATIHAPETMLGPSPVGIDGRQTIQATAPSDESSGGTEQPPAHISHDAQRSVGRGANSQQPIVVAEPIYASAAAPNSRQAIIGAEPNRSAPPGASTRHPKLDPTPSAPSDAAARAFPEPPRQVPHGDHMLLAMRLWDPLLQTLASGLDDIESARIAQANRLRILTATAPDSDGETRGFGLDGKHPAVIALHVQLATLAELEKGMTKALSKQLKTHPLHPWISAQVALGDKQVARLLAAIRDPYWNDLHDRPRTVSELWAFCGLHVLPAANAATDAHSACAGGSTRGGSDTAQWFNGGQTANAGVAPARRRGQVCNWSQEARTRIYVIAESCLKNRRSPYRPTYDDGRAKYAEAVHQVPCVRCGPKGKPALEGSPLSDGHKHARAMRLVMKHVLKDLWIESKRLYGSP